jgi:DnaJ like chaperone protein
MGWFGKLTFGSLGLFLGGPLGAIAGAVLGHHLIDKRTDIGLRSPHTAREPMFEAYERAQAAYFISLFSILGKFAKQDGVVTRDEIAVVENFIDGLDMSHDEKQFAKDIFRKAKDSEYSIENFAIQLHQSIQHHPTVLASFLNLLFRIAAADGNLHPAEEAALQRIRDIFGISEQQFDHMKAVYFNQLDKYYRTLNCTPECSDQVIKSNYKKLVKEFHPDTIISKGLPDEFMDFASERFREIQEAYEKIKQERRI